MNFRIKNLMLFLTFALVSVNIKSISEDKIHEIERDFHSCWNTGDYITQTASICSIDSGIQEVVDILAKFRTLINGLSNLSSTYYLYRYGAGYEWPINVTITLEVILRSFYIFKDIKIWENGDAIVSDSNDKKCDKNLKYKKLCQYLWLTLNKALPIIVNNVKGCKSKVYYLSAISCIYSELCRQYLMYRMIENKQKSINAK